MITFLAAVIAFLLGIFIGYIQNKADTLVPTKGTLIVAHDESEPPYIFLRLNHDYEIPESGFVTFDIRHEYTHK